MRTKAREAKRIKITNANKNRLKSTKTLPSQEEAKTNAILSDIRTKVYTEKELTNSELNFMEWYISTYKIEKFKFNRTWNIRSYHALNLFQNLISRVEKDENYNINIFKLIMNMEQSLNKDSNNYDNLQLEVSEYYKDCFMNNKDGSIVLFESKNTRIKVSFKKNVITYKNIRNNKTYERDIILSELDIFPNPRLSQQFIK